MIYVGIDIAKETHYAAALGSDGKVLVEPFAFSNDLVGFNKLLKKIKSSDKNNILFGLESTAHYGENLIFFLFKAGFNVCVINPLRTAALRKSNIRNTKTDKIDALTIAKFVLLNDVRLLSAKDIEHIELKSLCRFRHVTVRAKAKAKTQLSASIDVVFPEYRRFFKSGIHGKASYALLKAHPAPDEIAALHLPSLTKLLKDHSRGRFQKEVAVALKSLAASSVGVRNAGIYIQIVQLIQQIELFEQQIDKQDGYIAEFVSRSKSVLLSVPGIGTTNAAIILSEIGDISRFSSPCKLLAFAGLDPSVRQSGKFIARSTRMSKRGSRLLRYALINAAWNVSLNNATFETYFKSKRAQGKSHFNALGHTAHKLVRVIFKLLSSNTEFALT